MTWINQKAAVRTGLFFLFIFNIIFCYGQEPRVTRPTSTPTSPVRINSGSNNVVSEKDTASQDSAKKVNSFKTLFKGKPGRAALYSLLIPSGGQIYNRKWWKVPLALGIDGALAYNVYQKKKEYNNFNDILNQYNEDPKFQHPVYSKDQARNFRSATRGNVEYAWAYLVIGHILLTFEAYVDRHLMGFDVTEDFTIAPSSIEWNNKSQPACALVYRF